MTPDIAIIDSGINPGHPHVGPITGGHGYETDPETGQVAQTGDFMDNIGHGTAIAGIIKEKVPDAGLYAVKIFSRDLGTSVPVLTQALAWCVRRKFDIFQSYCLHKVQINIANLLSLRVNDRSTVWADPYIQAVV